MSATVSFPVEIKIPAILSVNTGVPRTFVLTGEPVQLPPTVIEWMQSQRQYEPLFADLVDEESTGLDEESNNVEATDTNQQQPATRKGRKAKR